MIHISTPKVGLHIHKFILWYILRNNLSADRLKLFQKTMRFVRMFTMRLAGF